MRELVGSQCYKFFPKIQHPVYTAEEGAAEWPVDKCLRDGANSIEGLAARLFLNSTVTLLPNNTQGISLSSRRTRLIRWSFGNQEKRVLTVSLETFVKKEQYYLHSYSRWQGSSMIGY